MARYYLTCAIDYANGEPHAGHAFEKVGADVIARYRRSLGDDVRFAIGMDEHGQGIAEEAARRLELYGPNVLPEAKGRTLLRALADQFANHVGEAEGGLAVYCEDGQLQEERCDRAGEACGYDEGAEGYRCMAIEEDPCQGIDALGTCDGETSLWCVGGELRRFDCGGCGWACGWVNDGIGYDCLSFVGDEPEAGAVSDDPCDGLDYSGRCDGSVAEWCDGGEYRQVDCAGRGQICDFVDEQIGYYCQEPQESVPEPEQEPEQEPAQEDLPEPEPVDPCDGLDFYGRCNGTVAEWCHDGVQQSVNCALYGASCRWIGSEQGYYCAY